MKTKIEYLIRQIALLRPKCLESGKQKEIDTLVSMINNVNATHHTVMVCGEFKRGKSSFINALLGKDLCAVDQDICTAVATVIRYGEKPMASRSFGKIEDPTNEAISIDSLNDYTVGNSDLVKETNCVSIALPLELLKGFTIIDTPGVGGLNPRHAYITNSMLPKADVALFMADVCEPLTAGELDFLCDNVCRYAKNVVIILNKADLKTAEEVLQLKEDISDKVEKRLKRKIEIITVSARKKSRYDKRGNEADLKASNYAEIGNMLQRLVNAERGSRLRDIQRRVIDLMEYFIKAQKLKLASISVPTKDAIEQIAARQRELEAKCAALANSSSPFMSGITARINETRSAVFAKIREESVLMSTTKFAELLHNPNACGDNGGQWVGIELNKSISRLGAESNLMIEKAFAEIAKSPELEGFVPRKLDKVKPNIKVSSAQTDISLVDRIGSELMPSYGLGMAAYLGLGVIGITTLAAPIAVCAGALFGISRHISSSRKINEAAIQKQYAPQIQIETQRLSAAIEKVFADFQKSLQEVLRLKLEANRMELEAAKTDFIKAYSLMRSSQNSKQALERNIADMEKVKDEVANLFNTK